MIILIFGLLFKGHEFYYRQATSFFSPTSVLSHIFERIQPTTLLISWAPGRRRWDFTEGLGENDSEITELSPRMWVSWIQHSLMSRVSSARGKHPCWSTHISVRTMNEWICEPPTEELRSRDLPFLNFLWPGFLRTSCRLIQGFDLLPVFSRIVSISLWR